MAWLSLLADVAGTPVPHVERLADAVIELAHGFGNHVGISLDRIENAHGVIGRSVIIVKGKNVLCHSGLPVLARDDGVMVPEVGRESSSE